MELSDAQKLVNDCELQISEPEIKMCFGMSKMTVMNEFKDHLKYTKLLFVEFLEFIARLAATKYKSMDNLPLNEKIEALLDDLLEAFRLKRNDVNVQVEEISESDNDY